MSGIIDRIFHIKLVLVALVDLEGVRHSSVPLGGPDSLVDALTI